MPPNRPRSPAPLKRRTFARLAGTWALAAPFIRTCGAAEAAERAILDSAAERIAKHRKGRATLRLTGPGGHPMVPGTAITLSQTGHRFRFGCNLFMLDRCRTPDDNARYAERFAALLNYATLPFYWWTYEPVRDRADDAQTERTVRWCRDHGITPKGHPLAWNFVDPPWMHQVPPPEVLPLQIERIGRCMSRFRGSIELWDVVNEATHYDRADCFRNAPRLSEAIQQAGVGDYLRRCFRAARKANPGATLLINDYRTDPGFATKVLAELVDEAQKPLYDVIGIQSHMHSGFWGAAKLWEVCDRFASHGRPLHFTESTIVSGPQQPSGWKSTPEGERQQAALVRDFYTVLFSHPAVEAITWWDFSDQGAWQHAPAGLLRHDLSPKPAYEVLRDLVQRQWRTVAQTTAQDDGTAAFEGFFGDYQATARIGPDGQALTGRFAHNRAGSTLDLQLT